MKVSRKGCNGISEIFNQGLEYDILSFDIPFDIFSAHHGNGTGLEHINLSVSYCPFYVLGIAKVIFSLHCQLSDFSDEIR